MATFIQSMTIGSDGSRTIENHEAPEWFVGPTIEVRRAAAWNRIKAARTEAEFGPFTYNNMEFDGDANAQRRLSGYISVSKSKIAAGEPYVRMFKLANNSIVTLSAQDFVAIELAKVDQIAAAFLHAEVLSARINAATTSEELEGIQWKP